MQGRVFFMRDKQSMNQECHCNSASSRQRTCRSNGRKDWKKGGERCFLMGKSETVSFVSCAPIKLT